MTHASLQPPMHIALPEPAETDRLARRIGARLAPGDTLLLEGGIGAGKTHFARALIQSLLETPEDVPSPTFTLVQVYDTAKGPVWHADLYRLTAPDEVQELGLLEAFDSAVCLVEWPDRLGSLAPEGALSLQFDAGRDDTERAVTLRWSHPGWAERLKGLEQA